VSQRLPIRIMFVDDHPIVREGLTALLSRQEDMTVIAEAEDGQQALLFHRQHRPDVTLMDITLPGMGGIEAIGAIRQEFPEARIIVLTLHDGDEDIYRALAAGARAYLMKDTLRRELLDAIRAVHAGQRYISPVVASHLAEHIVRVALTPRELEVLALIVKGRSNKEIAAELHTADGTVRIQVSSVLAKLGVADRTQAAIAAIQRGIVHL
jgi:two-component system, NarL family, response regulator